ncbi:hypothetical protein [Pseudomonas sp. NPDC096950]|uniref:hypothetical protein n=1 Tax=Pseudomonas sp. NPDC096950 TaxID=3364485 RepID=UPI00383A3D88
MTAKNQLMEMTVAAFEPGASRKGLTKLLIDHCKREDSPDLLLRTPNLALYELDPHEADDVLDFAFSVVEAKRIELSHFVSQQLTYSVLAGNFVFSEHLLTRSSAIGLIPLGLWFCYWTDHTDRSISWLKENIGRVKVFFESRFFDQFWKHMSSQGLIDLLQLIGRADLEKRILSLRKAEQDYCGGLSRLIDLGRIPDDLINAKIQSLIVARDISNQLHANQMTIEDKVYIAETTLDALTELFVDAVCVAPDHDARRLLNGFEAILGEKVVDQDDRDRA